eukprot:14958072-Alexandrium_andersonii.AAC.1
MASRNPPTRAFGVPKAPGGTSTGWRRPWRDARGGRQSPSKACPQKGGQEPLEPPKSLARAPR